MSPLARRLLWLVGLALALASDVSANGEGRVEGIIRALMADGGVFTIEAAGRRVQIVMDRHTRRFACRPGPVVPVQGDRVWLKLRETPQGGREAAALFIIRAPDS